MRILRLATACLLVSLGLQAQVSEPLNRWQYYQQIEIAPGTGLGDVVLDEQALDGSRDDGRDLRLYDSAGKEIPYALRVLRDVNRSDAFEANAFNRSTSGLTAEVTLDLGASPEQHNEVDIDTAGQNFRRRVDILGSPDGASWFSLREDALIFRFSSGGRGVDERSIDYPPSRYRYLRVRVAADPLGAANAPKIESVVVRRHVKMQGEETLFPAGYPVREATRENGRPASTYTIDLQGRIPLQAIRLSIAEGAFSRPYRLERIDGDATGPVYIASGILSRSEEQNASEVTLRFEEVFARQLRLVVTDDRNPALQLFAASAISAARQVIFDRSAGQGPLRLYYGNPMAGEPRYDFASALPMVLQQQPQRFFLASRQDNPDYTPPELPFTERAPWAVYVVLAAAGLALFWILRGLVQATEAAPPAAAAD